MFDLQTDMSSVSEDGHQIEDILRLLSRELEVGDGRLEVKGHELEVKGLRVKARESSEAELIPITVLERETPAVSFQTDSPPPFFK